MVESNDDVEYEDGFLSARAWPNANKAAKKKYKNDRSATAVRMPRAAFILLVD